MPVTHERNVLVWTATYVGRVLDWLTTRPRLTWSLLIIIIAIALLMSCGPTQPDPVNTHPNEIAIVEFTQCYAKHAKLGEIEVIFHEKNRPVSCPAKDAPCYGKGWAWPLMGIINYWAPWVRGEIEPLHPWSLEMLAAHEVAHSTGIWNEHDAETWAVLTYTVAGCHQGEADVNEGSVVSSARGCTVR
jgi:hypothetical protein